MPQIKTFSLSNLSHLLLMLGLALGGCRSTRPEHAEGAEGGYPLDAVTRLVKAHPMRASSGLFDPESNRDPYHVRPGQRLVLADLLGPGEIRHIWFTIGSRNRRYPRSLILRIYWDGAENPSVESPIGDFFAAGNGMRANVNSLPIEVNSYGRALNSYWHMPFRRRARIEVENLDRIMMTVYFQCDWLKKEKNASLPDDTLYFHARYKQDYPPKPFSVYKVTEIKGQGQYVGTVLSSQNNIGSWFGESDDRFYIDGEREPSLIGTGLEDYFNDAWNLRLFTYPRRGVTICETKGEERRITAFRWHLEDPIPFEKSLKMEIERRSYCYVVDPKTGKRTTYDFKYRPDDFSSVAFWYHKGVADMPSNMPARGELVPHEVWVEAADLAGENRVKTSEGLRARRASNRTCRNKKMCLVRNEEIGGWAEFEVPITQAGRYSISVFQVLFRHYGVFKVSLEGPGVDQVLHEALDFFDTYASRKENWPENYHHGTVREKKLGLVHMRPGTYKLRFTCVGANPSSRDADSLEFGKGYSIGLDAMVFRKLRITDPHAWMMQYLKDEEALFAEMREEARTTIASIAEKVKAFQKEHSRYPRDLSAILSEKTYDPWGQPYRYRAPGEINVQSFDLYSVHGNARKPRVWIGNWAADNKIEDAIEGESLRMTNSSPGARATRQGVSSETTAPISGRRILFLSFQGRGDFAEIALPADVAAGRYAVYVFLATSWDYGMQRWTLAGQPLGEAFDAHSPVIGRRVLPRAEVEIGSTAPILRVEITGKNDYALGFKAGLDAILLERLN